MNRQSVCAALVLTLVLLTGCASKTPAELARADGTEEAASAVETLEFAPREAYHLAEIEVQSVEDGAVLTVDGVCELSVKGFGCGKTITADGKTCAGAKTGETLVWLTCDYTNLTENEVSPGRLLESGLLRYDSGSAEGKSASFAKLLPGRTAEVYFYYAIPESLAESPLTLQFTIDGQTYSYEIPADKSAALAPTVPEEPEPDEKSEDVEQITLQESPKQETDIQTEENTPSKEERTESLPERVMREDGGYYIYEYDSAGRVIKCTWYDANGKWVSAYGNKFDTTGNVAELYTYHEDGSVAITKYFTAGKLMRRETEGGGFVSIYEYDGEFIRVTDYNKGVYYRTWIYQNGHCIGYLWAGDEEMTPWTENWDPGVLK